MEKENNSFFKDWTALQDDIEAISKSEDNPFFHSKYVPLKVILPILKEKCKKHNFIFMQSPNINDAGKNVLSTVIEHITGDKFVGNVELVAKDNNDPQKLGGAITYMRRYSLTCMFNLIEEDDDGNKAAGKVREYKREYKNEPIKIATPVDERVNLDMPF